jgi:hypothetical protein
LVSKIHGTERNPVSRKNSINYVDPEKEGIPYKRMERGCQQNQNSHTITNPAAKSNNR